jgi:phosphatidylglycerol:prolipoprotein diacylglycerol transferase
MINPVVFKFGPLELHAFTAWIALGVVIGLAIVLITVEWRQERKTPWLDAIVAAVVGGVIGARAVHVWLNWAYFSAHTDQITVYSSGGLDWHGAVALGLLCAIIVAMVRHVPIKAFTDALALTFPIGAVTVWLACAASASAYGVEVRTLADFPGWLVIESPDVYGTIAPRINLAPIGIALAIILLAIIVALTVFRRFEGLRLWLALALYALSMAVIEFFRADYVATWFGRRGDQILDLAVALVAILIFGILGLAWRKKGQAQPVEQGV